MEKREEHRKKEWQKPEYKCLNFSQTLGGAFTAVDEGDYTDPVS